MAIAYADRVQETTTTTGTGTLTLAGALTGFQSFTTAFSTGTTVYFCVTDGGANWEVSQGVFTTSGATLTRATVLASSNGGALVSFGGGTKYVFCVIPAVVASGVYVKTTVLTSASGTFTTGPNTTKIKIRGVAGGGAGGGGTGSTQGGGGAGSYVEKTFAVSPSTGYSYTCGAAGVCPPGGFAGGAGGNSTFTVGATTVTCYGGSGGPTPGPLGGAGGVISTNGDLNIPGQNGDLTRNTYQPTTVTYYSGGGGSSQFGAGAAGVAALSGGGQTATGYGAGGSGGSAASTSIGGNGSPGCWVVDEYA